MFAVPFGFAQRATAIAPRREDKLLLYPPLRGGTSPLGATKGRDKLFPSGCCPKGKASLPLCFALPLWGKTEGQRNRLLPSGQKRSLTTLSSLCPLFIPGGEQQRSCCCSPLGNKQRTGGELPLPLRGNGGKRQAVALPYPQRGKTGGGKETNGKGNLIVIGSCPPAVRPKGERATYGATKGRDKLFPSGDNVA